MSSQNVPKLLKTPPKVKSARKHPKTAETICGERDVRARRVAHEQDRPETTAVGSLPSPLRHREVLRVRAEVLRHFLGSRTRRLDGLGTLAVEAEHVVLQ